MSPARKVSCPQCRDTGGVVLAEGLTVSCGTSICERRREELSTLRAIRAMQEWVAARDRRGRALGAPK